MAPDCKVFTQMQAGQGGPPSYCSRGRTSVVAGRGGGVEEGETRGGEEGGEG